MSQPTDALDNAAVAALYAVAREKPTAFEHLGLLYNEGQSVSRTPTVSRNSRGEVKGRFSIPAGSLAGLFHDHPIGKYERPDDPLRAQFSPDDIAQAQKFKVPSYISAGQKVMRYDPTTGRTEEVLAELPVDEIKKLYVRSLSK